MILTLLRILPRKYLSHIFGLIVHIENPRFLALFIKKLMISGLKIETKNAEHSLEYYKSFGHFFSRALKPGERPISTHDFISPCDGVIDQCGEIVDGSLIQCKGLNYPLTTLLSKSSLHKNFNNGYFITIYLAPHDYHRVHCPVDCEIKETWLIEGDLWPVNKNSVRNIPELFCVNERWISRCESKLGEFLIIMVGATNVGKMTINHIHNKKECILSKQDLKYSDDKVKMNKGQHFGTFNMGSTVIIILSEEFKNNSIKGDISTGRVLCNQTIQGLT